MSTKRLVAVGKIVGGEVTIKTEKDVLEAIYKVGRTLRELSQKPPETTQKPPEASKPS